MRYFKLVMIVLLKICATEKVFGKICLKIIRDTSFFRPAASGRTGGLKFLMKDIYNRKGSFKLMDLQGDSPNTRTHRHTYTHNSLPSETFWFLHKENPEEGVWYVYCNDIEKNAWEYLLSKQLSIYNM